MNAESDAEPDAAPKPDRGPVNVAVGVLIRADGAVLFCRRPQGKPYAGWWELPGGKVEPGEGLHQALARELGEELGIRIGASMPWLVRQYRYEHAFVRLHFRRVRCWHGDPHAREGQELSWQQVQAIDVGPMLPASIPVIESLRLPSEYAISAACDIGVEGFLARLHARLEGGLRLLQLREPAMNARTFDALFADVLDLCQAHCARLLVNSVHPSHYWQSAQGVHLRSADLLGVQARPELPLVGASCHNPAELARAGELGADFAVLGPVAPTPSHPGADPLGWPEFERIACETLIPVYALGGLRGDALDEAVMHGAHGVALRSAAWQLDQAPAASN